MLSVQGGVQVTQRMELQVRLQPLIINVPDILTHKNNVKDQSAESSLKEKYNEVCFSAIGPDKNGERAVLPESR